MTIDNHNGKCQNSWIFSARDLMNQNANETFHNRFYFIVVKKWKCEEVRETKWMETEAQI